jgi:hypothetical protein
MRRLFLLNFVVYATPALLFALASTTWGLSALFTVCAAVGYRSVQSATIELNESGIVVLPAFRRHRLPWERIVDVNVGAGSSAVGLAFRVPAFTLTDGSIIKAQGVRSRRTPSVVDDVVSAARLHLVAAPGGQRSEDT